MFARDLDAELHCIHNLRFQSKAHAPAKYVLQAARTIVVLFRARPRAVHVQNPPCVCGFVVALYCWFAGARYVLDHHSAAFLPVWRWFGPLQRRVARGAATNIVTSTHWADVVAGWGAPTLLMRDAFRELPPGAPVALDRGPHVLFVGSFAFDEPLDAVLVAAADMPDVSFLVTGDTERAPAGLIEAAPANVRFTGFLPYEEYLGLLRAVDVVVALTTRDHTLQGAGCEAISVGTPLVTSTWPYLREVFEGMVFVGSSAPEIRRGIEDALVRHDALAAEARDLRTRRRAQWNAQLERLERVMVGSERIAPVMAEGAVG
ncbi:MAG TPA: glycosyltransferase family 4 protein [Acidimicrobiia bacterium]|nr:glycosyltransferase family 4 protein [Acidimicrobiia bacterium]